MHKALKVLCVTAAAAALTAVSSCDGGKSGGSAPPQNAAGVIELKDNAILGALPKMYVEHMVAKEAARVEFEARLQAETEKMGDNIDHDALASIHEGYEKTVDDGDGKFQDAVNAEWEKVSGANVPFAVSDAFGELLLNVSSVKIDGANRSFDLAVTVRADFTVNWDNNRYKEVWYNVLASDGSIITEGAALLVTVAHKDSVSFAKGQVLKTDQNAEGGLSGGLNLLRNPVKWMDFASVKFIDAGERTIPDPRQAAAREVGGVTIGGKQ